MTQKMNTEPIVDELCKIVDRINSQIEHAEQQAKLMKIGVHELMQMDGSSVMGPLLVGMTQALHALAMLAQMEDQQKSQYTGRIFAHDPRGRTFECSSALDHINRELWAQDAAENNPSYIYFFEEIL